MFEADKIYVYLNIKYRSEFPRRTIIDLINTILAAVQSIVTWSSLHNYYAQWGFNQNSVIIFIHQVISIRGFR